MELGTPARSGSSAEPLTSEEGPQTSEQNQSNQEPSTIDPSEDRYLFEASSLYEDFQIPREALCFDFPYMAGSKKTGGKMLKEDIGFETTEWNLHSRRWLKTTKRKEYTLVFPMERGEQYPNGGRILLGLKRRGFATGRWNGFGGKVEEKESVSEAAVRELEEESGLKTSTTDLHLVGKLFFAFENQETMMDVSVFMVEKWKGTEQETDEMTPKWYAFHPKRPTYFDIEREILPFTPAVPPNQIISLPPIPLDQMWPDDHLWFPLLHEFQPASPEHVPFPFHYQKPIRQPTPPEFGMEDLQEKEQKLKEWGELKNKLEEESIVKDTRRWGPLRWVGRFDFDAPKAVSGRSNSEGKLLIEDGKMGKYKVCRLLDGEDSPENNVEDIYESATAPI